MTTATATIVERSRELHAAYSEASARCRHAACRFAYSDGTRAAWTAASKAKESIWLDLLALHRMTADEWGRTTDSDRRRLWGF